MITIEDTAKELISRHKGLKMAHRLEQALASGDRNELSHLVNDYLQAEIKHVAIEVYK
jgi:hypothetical protein